MALDANDLISAVVSKLLGMGICENVNGHEPKSAPGKGLTSAVWIQGVTPVPSSGLASTSTYVVLNVRLYTSMLANPQDAIDPNLLDALSKVFAEFSGDFDLGGRVRSVDLLGQHGISLSADAGYLTQDGNVYRIFTIQLPLIINDAWEQVA